MQDICDMGYKGEQMLDLRFIYVTCVLLCLIQFMLFYTIFVIYVICDGIELWRDS